MKYIDADDLAARLIGDKYKVFREILQSEPEAIVRCKGCKYWGYNDPWDECRWSKDETPNEDDYCSYGERKEE